MKLHNPYKGVFLTLALQRSPLWLGITISLALISCLQAKTSAESSAQEQSKTMEVVSTNPASVSVSSYGMPSLSGLVKQLRQSVVNIHTTQVIKPAAHQPKMRPRKGPQMRDPLFDEFFGGRNPFESFDFFSNPPQQEFKTNALGSGFIISPDGYILTNHHVVGKASEIKVKLFQGKTYDAKVVGSDEKTDIALIKIESKEKLPATNLGDSNSLEVGDWVVAIGNPFGLGNTVTAGILSGKDREIGQGPYDDFLQTDASINFGNSGGPLFDLKGNVVGINTAIVSGGSGIGFAVPSNLVKGLLPQLKTKGKVVRGWLGVGIQDITEELAGNFGVGAESGVLVAQVFKDGPADKAKIQAGDIIVTVDGREVKKMRELTGRIAEFPPGSKVTLEIIRAGKKKTFTATLGDREQGESVAMGTPPREEEQSGMGLALVPLNPELARRLGVEENLKGLVVQEVDPSGPAANILQPGDIILEVNRNKVHTIDEFQKALSGSKKKGSYLFQIQRGSSQLFLVLRQR